MRTPLLSLLAAPSNPRLQRTPSAPLSRKPLGGTAAVPWRVTWAVVILALGWAVRSSASTPPVAFPPSKADLGVLQLLSQGELGAETLKPFVAESLHQDVGGRGRVAFILGEAVRKRALSEETVWRTIEELGCRKPEPTPGQCRHFLDSFRAAVLRPPQQPLTLADARRRILKLAEEKSGGHLGMEADYAAAVIASRGMTLSDVLTCFVHGELPAPSDPADERVVAAIGLVERDGQQRFEQEYAVTRLREAFGSELSLIVQRSRGDSLIVEQVRQIPAALLDDVEAVRRRYVGDVVDSTTLCVMRLWRQGDQAPDQWAAWSQLLSCCGW